MMDWGSPRMQRRMLQGTLIGASVSLCLVACGKDTSEDDYIGGSGGVTIQPPGVGGADPIVEATGGVDGDGGSPPVVYAPEVGDCLDLGDIGFGGAGGAGVGLGLGGDFADGETVLRGAPLIFSPTMTSFGLSAVVGAGEPQDIHPCVRRKGDELWQPVPGRTVVAADAVEWKVTGLRAGVEYEYVIRRNGETLFFGRAVTQRQAGESYRFAIMTDSHTSPRDVPNPDDPHAEIETINFKEETLAAVATNIGNANPDFIVNLGDMIDYHDYGFNIPTPSANHTRIAYLNHRRLYQETLGNAAHFPVIGNWEGENGDFTREQIDTAREQRFIYVPGPEPDTYPEGGSPFEDYYAFTWGDALFVVLNVMTYTPTTHLLDGVGAADDWTLGEEQLSWLKKTLEEADSKWRFVMIHHTVGGLAGNLANSIYGRGGGLAAYVGEQALVHQLMLDHGVQVFFFGHDHVFTDMVVDGIHYTLPGSSGAPWKFGENETGYSVYWNDSGHALVEVSPESVRVEFVNLEDEVFYSYLLE